LPLGNSIGSKKLLFHDTTLIAMKIEITKVPEIIEASGGEQLSIAV
jgi:hypothetical protein